MAGERFETTVGEVCQIFDGPHATPKRLDSGPVFLGITSLKKGRIDLAASDHVSEEDFTKWTRRVTPTPGDVVFSYETKLGEAAIIPEGLRCCLGRRMGLMRPNPTKLDSRFLLFYYLGPEFQEAIRERTIHGSTVDRLALIEFPQFPLRIPPLPEQKAIAAILGSLDDKIELNRRMNATLEAMARALFQSWFVDFDPVRAKLDGRVPVGMDRETAAHFPGSFDETAAGHIPRRWRVGSIYEIANVIYGAPFASSLFNSEKRGKPLIRIRDLSNESPAVFTTEVHHKGYLLQPGDIAVGMDGEFRAYLWAGEESWLNQRVCVFAPKSGYSAAFVRNSIIAPLAQVEATETATTVIHLGKNDIDRFTVIIPDAPVAKSFKQQCQPWYDQIVANKQQSRTLATLRDTLLPKLLSGELSVAGFSAELVVL